MGEQVEFTQPTTGRTVSLGWRNFERNYAHLVDKPKPRKKAAPKKDETDGED